MSVETGLSDQTEENLLTNDSRHMSGSDIETLGTESSDSFEVLNSGEHLSNINTQHESKELLFDVNAHGHQPTPQLNPSKIAVNMESQNIAVSESGGSACAGEYREISSDNEDEDDITIDETSSTPSSPSQISPNHRIVYQSRDDTDEESQDNATIERPGSLSLPKPLQYYEKQQRQKNSDYQSDSCSDVSRSSSTAALIEEASKTPLTKQGTVVQEGDMIAFVADGLNDMIKMSSPLSRTGSSVSGSLQSPGVQSVSSVSSSTSAWSDATSSASEWSRDYSRMSRPVVKSVKKKKVSPSILTASPDDIPSVDPRAIMELEVHSTKVANSVQHMMGTLKNNLYKMSALSYHCLDAHRECVDGTCDSVDSSIKAMYALMAKCEELSECMKPVYDIHTQIKEIERLLDLFESQMARDEKT